VCGSTRRACASSRNGSTIPTTPRSTTSRRSRMTASSAIASIAPSPVVQYAPRCSMYFDRMAEGRLGNVTALRRGDMLQDFFGNFREMHEGVRRRMQSDVITLESAAVALRAKATADSSNPASAELVAALEALDKHITHRKKQLL